MAILGLIVAGIASLSIGVLALFQRRRDSSVYYFFLTVLGTALWSFGIAAFLASEDALVAQRAAGFYYAAASIIAVATLLSGLVFGAKRPPRWPLVAAICTVGAAVAVTLVVHPRVLLGEATIASPNTVEILPLPYVLYAVYFVLCFGLGLFLMARRMLAARKRAHYRLLYVFGGYAVAGIIGMWFNLILPALGNYHFIWVGPLGLMLFVPIVYIAIVRYGLFDVRAAAVRGVTYILTLSVLASLYVLMTTAISAWLTRYGTEGVQMQLHDPYGINIAVTLLAVFLFQPIRRFFDRLTNRIFYRNRYSKDAFYAQLNSTLTGTVNLRTLLSRTSQLIAQTLNASQAFLFVYRENGRYVTMGTSGHARLPHQDAHWLEAELSKREDPSAPVVSRTLTEEGGDRSLRRFMLSHKLEIVLPLRQNTKIIGYLCIGDRQAGSYTERDLTVLATISDELVIAIQNALSLEEVKELNTTLQQRIEDATKELRTSNSQLRRLDEAKDEFISMASHQLRTPLTSVKGYIDMIIEGDAGDITPMQRKFLTEAFASSERMVHLINDFLNVSRLQTGKFVIDQRAADLPKIVQQELDGLRIGAEQRSLRFVYKKPTVFPTLLIDEAKIRQVIMNFADNALYYSKPGTDIHVKLALTDSSIEFTVKDTGIGVPLEEQAQLFTKFYRASNAKKQRPDGTGVGLYLAKRVVQGHGGEVIFSSTEGQGSTFGFRLPLRKLLAEDDTK